MVKRSKHVRVDKDTNEMLRKLSLELSAIEGHQVPSGEVVKRMAKGEDIPLRLKFGSMKRRKRP